MELAEYLIVLRRHWKGFAALILAGLIGGAVVTLLTPRVYTATASSMVQGGANSSVSDASVSNLLAKSRATSYVDVAQSRAVAERVIDAQQLSESPSALVQRVTVTQPKDTVLLRITATGPSPQAASDLANAWVNALAEQVKSIENPKGKNEAALEIIPLEAAAIPSAPSSPRPERNLALGLVLGGLLGLGYALLASRSDRRLRTPDEIEGIFGVTVAGAIPRSPEIHREGKAPIPIIVTHDKSRGSGVAESLFKLRTNLQFMHVDNPPRVIVLTSPLPADGKSTIAINLAAAFAVGGAPTLLVDADLRRPIIAESFGLIEGPGLSNALAGHMEPEDVIQPSGIPNLFVLASGTVPPNPSELLGSASMKRLLDHVAESYTVILDAPPLLPVTDAAVLTANADGALVVITEGQTEDRQLEGCLTQLAAVHGTVLGVVMNKVSKTSSRSYHYYGYYGSTYDGDSHRMADEKVFAMAPAAAQDAIAGSGPVAKGAGSGGWYPADGAGGRPHPRAGGVNGYSRAFREGALEIAAASGRPISQVAEDLGVNAALLRTWVDAAGGRGAGRKAATNPDEAELEHLRRENAALAEECDTLKRAVSLWSRESRS